MYRDSLTVTGGKVDAGRLFVDSTRKGPLHEDGEPDPRNEGSPGRERRQRLTYTDTQTDRGGDLFLSRPCPVGLDLGFPGSVSDRGPISPNESIVNV